MCNTFFLLLRKFIIKPLCFESSCESQLNSLNNEVILLIKFTLLNETKNTNEKSLFNKA